MDRRQFLKGLSGAVVAGAAMAAGCDNPNSVAAEGYTPGEVPTDKMTLRPDAHGVQVSLLGFGMMRLPVEGGGDLRSNPDAKLDQEAINQLVDYAIAHGVNYFDTAPVYLRGMSEEATGIALSRHPRDKWLIATKMSNFRDWSYEASIKMYHQSFEKLRVDTIDYYLLHSFGAPGDFDKRFVDNGVLDFLLKEREAGRIRNLGWSFHGVQEEFDKVVALHDKYHWDFAQIQMNYVDWRHAQEVNTRNLDASYLYSELERRGIPVVIMEPLLGGRLARHNEALSGELVRLDPKATQASWAFRFCGTYPGVLTILSGMTHKENIVDNVATLSPLKPLTEAELVGLERAARAYLGTGAIPCNSCNYCMPCPYGLDIPGAFEFMNRVRDARMTDPRAIRREYERAIPDRRRRADRCIGCGRCVTHCPQTIDIPKELDAIAAFMEGLGR